MNHKTGDKYVEVSAECFRTGVRLPPPPSFASKRSGEAKDAAPQSMTEAGFLFPAKRFEASARQAMINKQRFYYAYILVSIKSPGHFYTGFTEDLEDRLKAHNSGQCSHTSKFKP